MHMMKKKASMKTWHIVLERFSGCTDEVIIQADTLHEAFLAFSNTFYMQTIAGIRITEVKPNEKQEERPRAAVS